MGEGSSPPFSFCTGSVRFATRGWSGSGHATPISGVSAHVSRCPYPFLLAFPSISRHLTHPFTAIFVPGWP